MKYKKIKIINDPISESMNMKPNKEDLEIDLYNDTSVKSDFEFARNNIIETITEGKEALSRLKEITEVSDHPRVFEVYSTLMRTVVDSNINLLNLQKEKLEIESLSPRNQENNKQTINNNLIVTTSELQQLIKEMK